MREVEGIVVCNVNLKYSNSSSEEPAKFCIFDRRLSKYFPHSPFKC